MAIHLMAGKGKGKKNRNNPVTDPGPDPPPPPPPPGGLVITLSAKRYKGANGAGTIHVEGFVPPGVITSQADADNCTIKVAGTEVTCELTARGQHSDGSYNILQGYAPIASITAGVPVTVTIEVNTTPTVARSVISGKYVYTRNAADPRLAGYPDVIALPTDVDYLRTCRFLHAYDLQSRASTVALGGQYQKFWERYEDFSDWWWSHDAGAGTYGHAPPQNNNMAWSKCNNTNTTFNNINDWNLAAPADDFATWRVFSSYVTDSLYPGNSYDNCKIHMQAFFQSGFDKFFIRGLSYGSHYLHEFLEKQNIPGYLGENGYKLFASGIAAIYLTTNDAFARRFMEIQAHRYVVLAYTTVDHDNPDPWGGYGIGGSALLSDVNGASRGFDPRECSRPLELFLAGHRCRLTQSYWTGEETFHAFDYAANATTIVNRLMLTGQEWFARKADGTWRDQRCTDATGMYINTFMHGIQAGNLIDYYEQINADSRIISALRQCWDTLYSTLWGFWEYTFDGVQFFTAVVKSMRNDFDGKCANLNFGGHLMGDSSPIQLGFYPHWAAWVYKKTGILAYKTQADEAFDQAVGISTNAGEGPTLGELRSVSAGITESVTRKVFGEAHDKIMGYFTFRLG